MPTIVRLPEVLTGMSEATLLSWHVSPGEDVVAGQPLAEVETEKAIVECEAEHAGTVAGLLVALGQPVVAGTPIAVLADAGESIEQAMAEAGGRSGTVPAPAARMRREEQTSPDSAELPPGDASASISASAPATAGALADGRAAPVTAEPEPASDAAAPAPESPGRRRFASPIVRRLARERNIDLSRVQGSGPGRRIVRRDLDSQRPERAEQSAAPLPAGQEPPAVPPVPAAVRPAEPGQPDLAAANPA
jgi:pyruvate dehydrogenase E2 component (dihydrolipoamide acetyltransferase)